MSATVPARDEDGDSRMSSSPEGSDYFPDADDDALQAPSTPTATTSNPLAQAPTSELSPPSSTGPSGGRISAFNPPPAGADAASTAAATANANGMQSLAQESPTPGLGLRGGGVPVGTRGALRAASNTSAPGDAPAAGQPLGVHPSGYAWYRPEDEPGYLWKNKKAQEEWSRAWEAVVDKEKMVGNRYGDPCDERVMLAQKSAA